MSTNVVRIAGLVPVVSNCFKCFNFAVRHREVQTEETKIRLHDDSNWPEMLPGNKSLSRTEHPLGCLASKTDVNIHWSTMLSIHSC